MEEIKVDRIDQYLLFNQASETFAINVLDIKEVLTVPRITRVPRMSDFMTGVINLRGNIIPVLDLRLKFGLGPTPYTKDTAIIVLEAENILSDGDGQKSTLGIFSDLVQNVVTIEPARIETPPRIGLSINTSYIAGMAKIQNTYAVILDIRAILSEKELSAAASREVAEHE